MQAWALWRETERETEDKVDAMKALENRVEDSRREMKIQEDLEEIKSLNERNASLDVKELMNTRARDDLEAVRESGLTGREEELVSSITFGAKSSSVSRLADSDSDEDEKPVPTRPPMHAPSFGSQKETSTDDIPLPSVVIKKEKKRPSEQDQEQSMLSKKQKQQPEKDETTKQNQGAGIAALLGGYGSSSDDSD